MKLKRTQICIEKNIIKLLKTLAVEMDTSMAQVIRWILKSHLGLINLRDKPYIERLDKQIQAMNKYKKI